MVEYLEVYLNSLIYAARLRLSKRSWYMRASRMARSSSSMEGPLVLGANDVGGVGLEEGVEESSIIFGDGVRSCDMRSACMWPTSSSVEARLRLRKGRLTDLKGSSSRARHTAELV